MNTKNKGSFLVGLMLIIILLLVIAVAYLVLHKLNPNQQPITGDNSTTSTVATSTPDNVPPEWKTYVNNDFKYQFRYPETITYTKSLTTSAPDGNSAITYPPDKPINIVIDGKENVTVSPLYVGVNATLKPSGYTTLSKYVSDQVATAVQQGENSAAGVYASSSPTTINGSNGFLVVVSDGSVIKNRDDKYYFDHGSYIYTFDMAYSGYYYETGDADEVNRVDTAKAMLSTFKFLQ